MLGRLEKDPVFVEEPFGILTDDELYLDCILVTARESSDADLQQICVWVPKHPLTKTSTIACARQEVISQGVEGRVGHLVFDFRGTGESDGSIDDTQFEIDLNSIKAWAAERFGAQFPLSFFGTPTLTRASANLFPIRPGVVMESYHYASRQINPPAILYMSVRGHYNQLDDARCAQLAESGYTVYAIDPLRYLLHASINGRLTPEILAEDFKVVQQIIGKPLHIVSMSLSSGLGILLAAMVDEVRSLIAVGLAQAGFDLDHVFDNSLQHTFLLSRFVGRIAPKPLTLVYHEGHKLGGERKELAALYKASGAPHYLERTHEISPAFLQKMLERNLGQ